MSGVVVIGAPARVRGYAMTGVDVIAAEEPAAVVAAWHGRPADTGLVILTADAARALSGVDYEDGWPLVAVMDP
jgi:vacuolar-type H+-ATPase subunit F/Vma7